MLNSCLFWVFFFFVWMGIGFVNNSGHVRETGVSRRECRGQWVPLTHRGGSDHEDVEEDDDAAGGHGKASEEIRSEGDGQVAVTMLCLCHVSMGTGATSAQLQVRSRIAMSEKSLEAWGGHNMRSMSRRVVIEAED